jgi:hypothetical protein
MVWPGRRYALIHAVLTRISFNSLLAGQHSAGMALARTAFMMSGRIKRKRNRELGSYSGLTSKSCDKEMEIDRDRCLGFHFFVRFALSYASSGPCRY